MRSVSTPQRATKRNPAGQTRRQEIGQERREKTRKKLLAGAARAMAESGEHKATIDDFIQAAGVARGTFYNYYPTRDEILADLWASIGRNPFLRIENACEQLQDPAERLIATSRLVLETAARDATWGWVVYALSIDAATVNEDLLRFPRPDLDEGLRTRRFSFHDADAATDLIVGTTRSALHAVLSERRSPEYVVELGVLMLKALGLSESDARAVATRPLPSLDP